MGVAVAVGLEVAVGVDGDVGVVVGDAGGVEDAVGVVVAAAGVAVFTTGGGVVPVASPAVENAKARGALTTIHMLSITAGNMITHWVLRLPPMSCALPFVLR